jgi:short-subunit dehydrogenase
MIAKRALVTGGTRGLGLEVARLLASRNYLVTVVGREANNVDLAVRSLSGEGHRGWVFDLSQPASTRELLRHLSGEAFDLVINNAGGTRFGPLAYLTEAEVEEITYLNFTAPTHISRHFLRTAERGATLLNVTSIVGTVPMPGNSLYSAAKAALTTLSECLWFEARSAGVRVLEFRPVSLKTDFHRRAGGSAISAVGMAIDPALAARDLVRALETEKDFIVPYGVIARVLGIVNRLLPRRLMIWALAQGASRKGYFTSSPSDSPRG